MSGIDVPAPSEREALAELVACDKLTKAYILSGTAPRDYVARFEAAWAAARAALSVPCRLDTGWGSPGVGRQGGPGGCDVPSGLHAPAPSSVEKLNTAAPSAPLSRVGWVQTVEGSQQWFERGCAHFAPFDDYTTHCKACGWPRMCHLSENPAVIPPPELHAKPEAQTTQDGTTSKPAA